MSVLTSTELKRKFVYKKNNKEIVLDDFNPNASADEILKFYSQQYPELTTATMKPPEFKGNDLVFNISAEVGTKG